jgi:hypothetical protein
MQLQYGAVNRMQLSFQGFGQLRPRGMQPPIGHRGQFLDVLFALGDGRQYPPPAHPQQIAYRGRQLDTNRGAAPVESTVPTGPNVQESLGGAAPVVTHEDMIQTPHDEDLFEYYATSQLASVDAASGKVTLAGKPGIIESVRISPDARHLLVTIIHRPFSYLH